MGKVSVFCSAALEYSTYGFAVFPVKARNKRPLIEHGFKDATQDNRQIKSWWKKWPDANIGIATGQASGGLLVIDLDVDEEKGKNGLEELRDWEQEHGALPDTWRSITGRGGYHLFYFSSEKVKSTTNLYPGIDIRGEGGYIVAPPSIHENGNAYTWEQGPGNEITIAEVSDTIREFLKGPEPVQKQPEHFREPEIIHKGDRVNALICLIGSLKGKGLGDIAIRLAVEAENEERCSLPLTGEELEKEVFPSLERGWKSEKPYTAVCDNGVARPVKEFKPVTAISAADLDRLEIPPIVWLIDKILPVGLAVLVAPSKYYKSFMALDLCVSICTGRPFLGFKSERHACLYLDLESTKRRPQQRLNMIVGEGQPKPDNLYIITGDQEVGQIGDGFEKQIEYQLQEHSGIKLVVVDVLQKIRRTGGRKNQNAYERDYEEFKTLKKIADEHDICLLLIHHTRKGVDPSDPFNQISGSAALMGSSDCAWMIIKEKRDDADATFYITGRDLENRELKIEFDRKNFRWKYLGTVDQLAEQRRLFEYDQNNVILTIKKIAQSEQQSLGRLSYGYHSRK